MDEDNEEFGVAAEAVDVARRSGVLLLTNGLLSVNNKPGWRLFIRKPPLLLFIIVVVGACCCRCCCC